MFDILTATLCPKLCKLNLSDIDCVCMHDVMLSGKGFTWDGVIGRGARERKNPQGTGLAAHSFIALALN